VKDNPSSPATRSAVKVDPLSEVENKEALGKPEKTLGSVEVATKSMKVHLAEPVEAGPASKAGHVRQDEGETPDSADDEGMWVDEAVLKEETAARKAREKAAKAKPAPCLTKEKLQKLDKLVDQATMYSQFLGEQVNSVQDQWDQVSFPLSPRRGRIAPRPAAGPDMKRPSVLLWEQMCNTKLVPLPQTTPCAHLKRRDHAQVYNPTTLVQLDADEDAAVGTKRKKGAAGAPSKKAKSSAKTPTQVLVPRIQGELRSYQLKGVAWLISLWTNGMNGILADQMGLGKTVQTVAFLSHLRDNDVIGPFLIVVPLSTLMNWQKEVTRWCPSMSAIIYHGSKADRQAIERKWFIPEYSRANFSPLLAKFVVLQQSVRSGAVVRHVVADRAETCARNCSQLEHCVCGI
jgi:hypothetical protein